MRFKDAKRKWFEKNLLKFEITFNTYNKFGKTFKLRTYEKDSYYTTRSAHMPSKIEALSDYLNELSDFECFFKAREMMLQTRKNSEKLIVEYRTIKSSGKMIQECLRGEE